MTTYDFNKLLQDAKAGAAWPVADYDFEVADAMVKQASTGADMVVAKLRCLVGPYAGKHVTNNFVFSPDNPTALNIFFRHMDAFGLDSAFFTQIGQGDLSPVAQALRGRRARVTIGHRMWNGAPQNDIKAIRPLDGLSNVLSGGPQVPGTLPGVPSPPPPPPQSAPATYAPTAYAPPPPPPPPAYAPPAAPTYAPPTAPPPPPPPAPSPALAPTPTSPPAGPPPAPAPTPAPTPAPPPPPPPVPAPPAPAPVAVSTPGEQLPAGFTSEAWALLPDETKAMIWQATSPAPPAPPI